MREVDVGFLEHVGRINSALKPPVDSQSDHLTKSPAVTIKQPRYRAFVASLRACEERFDGLGLGLGLGLDFLFHLGLPLYQGDLRRHVDRTQADGANPTS